MSNQTKNATLVGGGGQKPLNSQSLENPKNAKGLDSKSKLESKNPNKIQTAKIQDSKIQLESDPKDFAKLESQKISKIELESKKIQRAKSTLDSTTKKAKESGKTKSFVRIIPTSIALASALSSNMAAAIPDGPLTDYRLTEVRDGTVIVNTGTAKDGTIINGTVTASGRQGSNVNGKSTIINGWNMKNNTLQVPENTIGTAVNGGVVVNQKPNIWNNGQKRYEVFAGTKAGDLTFNRGISASGWSNNLFHIGENASAGTITMAQSSTTNISIGSTTIINIGGGGYLAGFVNNGNGTYQHADTGAMIQIWGSGTLDLFRNAGNLTTKTMLKTDSGTINQVEFASGSSTTASQGLISVSNATIGTITATGATVSGSINLAGTSSITNGISLDNQSKMTGGITLGGSSNIAGISLANASTITGGVTLNGSSSIDNISISGSNASLSGNITMLSNDSTASIDNITISSGGTYNGTIHTGARTNISGITIANGGVVGSSNASSIIQIGRASCRERV